MLDEEDVRQAYEQPITDAYGEYEQQTGLLTMIEDELEFPFQAKVLGEAVTVVGME